jgi:hypothetical protein
MNGHLTRRHCTSAATAAVVLALRAVIAAAEPSAIGIGSRRELFLDGYLIDKAGSLEFRLHPPVPREIVLVHDAPWEGTGCGYHTVFRDGDVIRMYYVGTDLTNGDGTKLNSRPIAACYAESRDGVRWVKPRLGLVEFAGSKENNIVWTAPSADNFTPFKDPNPDCRPDERYKAVASGKGGLFAYKSADGLRWSPLADNPIITKGAFVTQAFWDAIQKQYWAYIRDFHKGIRDIRVATSQDFRTWTEPQPLKFLDAPDEPLYTKQVQPYYRAPHLFLGFPTRYIERKWSESFNALPDVEHRRRRMKFSPRYGTAITDGQFMWSRDGRTFRRWDESFLRPGPERRHNWLYGDCYQNLGLIETAAQDPFAPPELSIYATEDNWKRPTRLRRYTLRIDGFVSLHARQKPGEMVTKPLTFSGGQLTLNFSTSAGGGISVEFQDETGRPIPGFALADCDEVFGDTLERAVTWKDKSDVSTLAGKPVRIRMTLRDADVYSIRFRPQSDAP